MPGLSAPVTTTLAELRGDVEITSPVEADGLYYDASTGKWKNHPAAFTDVANVFTQKQTINLTGVNLQMGLSTTARQIRFHEDDNNYAEVEGVIQSPHRLRLHFRVVSDGVVSAEVAFGSGTVAFNTGTLSGDGSGLYNIPSTAITGLGTASTLTFDTDTTLASNSDALLPTQKAVKTYVDNAVTGLWDIKGSTNCSANPNYPAASKGDAYAVSVAGKIGGASGVSVDIGDVYVALADNAGGTQAAVGSSWFVLEHNLSGVALTTNTLAQFAATTSAQLAGVISDETGSGSLVFGTSPTIATPLLTGNTIIRAAGGSTSSQVEVSQSGAVTVFTVASGAANGQQFHIVTRDRTYKFYDGLGPGFECPTSAVISGNVRSNSTGLFAWSNTGNPTSSMNPGLGRAADGVVSVTNGSTAGATLSSVPLTPAQITANQNDYAPGVAWFYRLSTDASRDITGLAVSQVSGQVAEFWNVGSQNIVLKHDVTSTAANRFLCTGAADITLAANEVALLRYDATTARWRVRKV